MDRVNVFVDALLSWIDSNAGVASWLQAIFSVIAIFASVLISSAVITRSNSAHWDREAHEKLDGKEAFCAVVDYCAAVAVRFSSAVMGESAEAVNILSRKSEINYLWGQFNAQIIFQISESEIHMSSKAKEMLGYIIEHEGSLLTGSPDLNVIQKILNYTEELSEMTKEQRIYIAAVRAALPLKYTSPVKITKADAELIRRFI